MGGFHTGGCETLFNLWDQRWWGDCPDKEECKELLEQGPSWEECIATEWSNKLIERFSSVQATIEIEKPENYPKKRNSTCTHLTSCTEHLRYKRPDEYEGNEEDYFTSLCAFPNRTQGCPEDKENDVCYPFDGTYDIFTLGEAVEELINNHYKDGSDDQLLVYLYEVEI